jgi:hypothetical protein
MKAVLSVLFAGAVAWGLSGCIVRHHHDGYHDEHASVEVAIPVSHVHDDHCGHYYHRDRWYHRHQHRHGRGCGHVYTGGRWILRL